MNLIKKGTWPDRYKHIFNPTKIRFTPHFKDLHDRVRGGSKSRKKQGIIAVARKILVTAWAMLRDGKKWSPPQAKSMVQTDPQVASASTA
jgi:hypothetical protein